MVRIANTWELHSYVMHQMDLKISVFFHCWRVKNEVGHKCCLFQQNYIPWINQNGLLTQTLWFPISRFLLTTNFSVKNYDIFPSKFDTQMLMWKDDTLHIIFKSYNSVFACTNIEKRHQQILDIFEIISKNVRKSLANSLYFLIFNLINFKQFQLPFMLY